MFYHHTILFCRTYDTHRQVSSRACPAIIVRNGLCFKSSGIYYIVLQPYITNRLSIYSYSDIHRDGDIYMNITENERTYTLYMTDTERKRIIEALYGNVDKTAKDISKCLEGMDI